MSKPRGRPRAFDVETVLEQSMQLFWTSGFDGTSLDDIAAATGVARPSLAAAFGGKEAMYVRALERFGGRMTQIFDEAFSESVPLSEALSRYYLGAIDLYVSGAKEPRGCLAFCTATTAAPNHPTIGLALARVLQAIDSSLKEAFRRARERGDLSPSVDSDELALLAAATLQSLAIRVRAGEPPKRLRDLASRLAGALCSG